jgi:hypothetical protein
VSDEAFWLFRLDANLDIGRCWEIEDRVVTCYAWLGERKNVSRACASLSLQRLAKRSLAQRLSTVKLRQLVERCTWLYYQV